VLKVNIAYRHNGGISCLLLLLLMAAAFSGCAFSDTPANNLPDSTIWHVKANVDGSQLLYAHSENVVGLWHANTLKTTWLNTWADSVGFLSFTPNGAHFIVGGTLPRSDSTKRPDFRVAFYGARNAEIEQTVNLPSNTSRILCANDNWIIVSTENPSRPDEPSRSRYSVNVWRHQGNQWNYSHKFSKQSENVAVTLARFIDDNRIVAYLSHINDKEKCQWQGGEIMIVDLDAQQVIRRAVMNVKPGAMSVSEGGKYVAVGDFETVEIYDTSSLTRQGKSSVLDVVWDCPRVAVSCGGRYVAYASASLEVRDLQTNTVVFRDKSREDIIRSKIDFAELSSEKIVQQYPNRNNAWIRMEFCFQYISFVDASGSNTRG